MAQLDEWGLSLVSLGVITLVILIELHDLMLKPEEFDTSLQGFAKKRQLPFVYADAMFESIAGYGLGAHPSLFRPRYLHEGGRSERRLSGKNEYGFAIPHALPAILWTMWAILAGMGADLFGSFAEATCVALVLVAPSNDLQSSWKTLMYPCIHLFPWNRGGIVTCTLATSSTECMMSLVRWRKVSRVFSRVHRHIQW